MDAITHTVTRRLDSSLHAVGHPTTAVAVESVRTLSVTAESQRLMNSDATEVTRGSRPVSMRRSMPRV